jgi:hypothetical protein
MPQRNGVEMTENKPKIEGKPRYCRRPARNVGPAKKEFVTKVVGLEPTPLTSEVQNTCKILEIGGCHSNHVQKEYKGGPKIAKAIKELSLPTISIPNYLTANLGGNVDPGDVFLWQQDVQEAMKRITLLVKKKKHVYALVLGQCLTELIREIKGLDGYI